MNVKTFTVAALAAATALLLLPHEPARAAVNQIVYESYASGDSDIWIMNADGTGQTNLTPNTPDSQEHMPELSPDGTQVTFVSNRLTGTNPDQNFEVFVMNDDGSNVRQVTVTDNSQPGSFIQSYDPTWSPDSTQLAFSGYRSSFGQSEVYKINVDGSGETLLTDLGDFANAWEPDWSPDGTKILFTWGWDEFNQDLRTVNPDGTGETTLTFEGTNAERNPQWSPDGTRIAFRYDQFSNPDVYVLEYPSLALTRVTTDPAIDEAPTWSPDGTTIAFSSSRAGAYDIYVIDAPPVATGGAGGSAAAPAERMIGPAASDNATVLNDARGDQLNPNWANNSVTPTTALLTVNRVGKGTVKSKPAGISCGSRCSKSFATGTTVTLVAQPARGWAFSGWSGACTGSATKCTVTVDSAKTVTATFTKV